jgi:predicted HAD superfamily phosphohydrolase
VREGPIKAATLDAIQVKTALPLERFVGIGDSVSDAPYIGRIVKQGGLGLAVTQDETLRDAGAVAVKDLQDAARMIQEFAEGKTP